MPIPKELEGILVSTPDTLSGAVRFAGTRVPVQALLDTILCGETIDYFLGGFPNVTRAQAESVVKWEHHEACQTLGLYTERTA
jgi:uncharacterized protein (DUF433 family)